MLALLTIFVAIALVMIGLITLSNVLIFPRLQEHSVQSLSSLPRVTVMIPARNEARVIANTITRMLAQDYPNFSVILLDDNSDDGTATIARQSSQGDTRLSIMNGQPLPDGWMGKNWACHQMAQRAQGEILVFTDADTRWEPSALRAIIADSTAKHADLYSIWPTQETHTWAERLCVPLMAMVVVGYLPIIGTHYVPLGAFGAANGQCMVWRKRAYDKIGGHKAVHDNVLEDVTMAKMVKAQGLRLRMSDGAGLVNCRMYTDWQAVRDGYAKNILAGYGSAPALMAGTVFHWSIFLFPFVLLLTGEPLIALLLILLGIIIRALTAVFTRQRAIDAILMPLSVLLMTRITMQALYWHYRFGGPLWKGRRVVKHNKHKPPQTITEVTDIAEGVHHGR